MKALKAWLVSPLAAGLLLTVTGVAFGGFAIASEMRGAPFWGLYWLSGLTIGLGFFLLIQRVLLDSTKRSLARMSAEAKSEIDELWQFRQDAFKAFVQNMINVAKANGVTIQEIESGIDQETSPDAPPPQSKRH